MKYCPKCGSTYPDEIFYCLHDAALLVERVMPREETDSSVEAVKICPTCAQSYMDDNLNFCLNDGATLTPLTNKDKKIPPTQEVRICPTCGQIYTNALLPICPDDGTLLVRQETEGYPDSKFSDNVSKRAEQICPNCGCTGIDEDMLFCPNCGTTVVRDETAIPPMPPTIIDDPGPVESWDRTIFTWRDVNTEIVFGEVKERADQEVTGSHPLMLPAAGHSDPHPTLSSVPQLQAKADQTYTTLYPPPQMSLPPQKPPKDESRILAKVRLWIEGGDAESANEEAARDMLIKPVADEFVAKLANAVEEVMQREKVMLSQGGTLIPIEYIIFLSDEDDKERHGIKRRDLELGLHDLLVERVREISRERKLETRSFAIELRVDGTLEKGEVRVRHSWDDASSNTTGILRPETQQTSQQKTEYAVNLSPGAVLAGRYEIKQTLGRGGFGEILTIVDEDDYLEEEQVLKLLTREVVETFAAHTPREAQKIFQSQYKHWKFLSDKASERVVRLYKVRRIEDRIGIFMEYLRGETLAGLVNEWGGKPQNDQQLRQLLRLLAQACRAVEVIHRYKLVHCDIKPQNFLLDESRKNCKICDFELLSELKEVNRKHISGTPKFMSREAFEGSFSVASDIYALGVTFYLLLSGRFPYESEKKSLSDPDIASLITAAPENNAAKHLTPLTELNPLVPRALNQIVRWCLEDDPTDRPQSVDELLRHLEELRMTEDDSNYAPDTLARQLLTHLSPFERNMLVKRLKQSELRSISQLREHREQDIIEEYCYTESPLKILGDCSEETLYKIAESFDIETEDPIPAREKLAKTIAGAIGFLPGNQNIRGLESVMTKLEELQIAFENSGTIAKQRGHLHEATDEIERAVDLVGGFYSKMLHLTGWEAFLRRLYREVGRTRAKGKPKFSLGQKIGALRELSQEAPDFPLDERVERGFKFPLLSRDIFEKLDWICTQRNKLAHSGVEFDNRQALKSFGREIFENTVETSRMLVKNPAAPRFVQITSSKEDEYGRHFYEGRDEKNREEKIFTPIGLGVGEVYAFFPLTNPVRIDPLIFPLD